MALNNFSALQRRSLAIGLMFLVMLSITLLIVRPMVTDYYTNQARITQLQQQLQRFTEQVQNRPIIEKQVSELKNNILGAKVFSAQKSIPLVLAEIQENIKKTVVTAGGELSSIQTLPTKTVNGVTQLGINASFSGKISQLKSILYELESAKPYMIIENIKIYGASNGRTAHSKIDSANKIMAIADIVTYIPPLVE